MTVEVSALIPIVLMVLWLFFSYLFYFMNCGITQGIMEEALQKAADIRITGADYDTGKISYAKLNQNLIIGNIISSNKNGDTMAQKEIKEKIRQHLFMAKAGSVNVSTTSLKTSVKVKMQSNVISFQFLSGFGIQLFEYEGSLAALGDFEMEQIRGWNTIEGAIVTDNIDAVQEFINQESFDINQKIKPSLYDTNSLKYDEATLIQLAALHGSENSFKYLYLNGGEINNKKYTKWSTSQFAVAGGNLEIIHFLEQNDINFDNTLFIAALFHHHHIFDWLCKNMNQKLQYCNDNKNVIFDCVKANNMIDFLKCIDMGCDINICIKGVFIFYLVIHHLLKQYCIIILIF